MGTEHVFGEYQQERRLLHGLDGCVSLNAEHVGMFREISRENVRRFQASDTVSFSQGRVAAEGWAGRL